MYQRRRHATLKVLAIDPAISMTSPCRWSQSR